MTKKLQPLISIIIPAFNAQASIERAVNSVLNQTYRSIELIVINDCSSDNTLELIRGLTSKTIKITVIENKTNRGVAAARNQGINVAIGNWVTFLDADDYFDHTYLEKVHNFLRHQEFVCTSYMEETQKPSNDRKCRFERRSITGLHRALLSKTLPEHSICALLE